MIQDFNPRARETERTFEPIEWGQYVNHPEEMNGQPGPSPVACDTPNPPPGCENYVPAVNIDIYIPMLIIIAVAVALMKLQKQIQWQKLLQKSN